ncbi:MAG: serine hydrolase domain-containing protein [Asgard group archaeon]|nr:serine hydrolase domain-containing protein [Asgard group archaeon]
MTKHDVLKKMEGLITNLMQQSKIPSLCLHIIEDDKTIYEQAFGARKLEGNLPATTDTLYGIGSVTKSFTCLAILQLHQQKKLDIMDSIKEYLPIELGDDEKPITIHHLMSHSSGVPNLGEASVLIGRHSDIGEKFVPLSSTNDFYNFINSSKEEVFVKPGERFFYFNSGYTLLGLIIEKVTGMKYSEYITKHILKPLEMNRSVFDKDKFEQDDNHMTPYFTDREKKFRSTMHPFDQLIYAAGGMLSSVNELKNYLLMYLQKGAFKDKKIIDEKLLDKMFESHIERTPGAFGKETYGYGWGIIENFFGEKMIHHGGSTGVSSAFLAMIPAKNLALALTANVGNSQASMITQALFATLLGKNPQTDHPVLKYSQKIDQLVGTYQFNKGLSKIEISKKGLTLYAKQIIFKEDEDKEFDFPILHTIDDSENYQFWIPQGPVKIPVEFITNEEKGTIDMIIERNVYHKASKN